MAELSGKDGTIHVGGTEVGEATMWSIEESPEIGSYTKAAGNGVKNKVTGSINYTGSMKFVVTDAAAPPVRANGTSYALKLYANATKYLSCNAFLSNLSTEVDFDSGDPLSYECDIEIDGPIDFTNWFTAA